MKIYCLCLVFVCLFAIEKVHARPVKGGRTLVISDNAQIKTTHSQFFAEVEAKGYTLQHATASSNIQLTEFGEDLFEHLIIFAPNAKEFGGEASTYGLVEFVKRGGNILIAASSTIGKATEDLAFECSIEFDAQSTFVIDHFNVAASDDGTHTTILSNNFVESKPLFSTPITRPVVFKGIGHRLKDNPLVFQILGGSSTSYSGFTNAIATKPHVVGKKTGLVSTLQALNSARVTFSGSLDLFSNKFFELEGSNKQFSIDVATWTFHDRGVLRVVSTHHHLKGETSPRQNYIVKNDIVFTLKAEEWSGDKWVAFQPKDLQIEAKMLNPYIRAYMMVGTNGSLTSDITLPDVHGVFTFYIEYNRLGYSFLKSSDIVPIHPLRHNQYERFIGAAYPYYATFFSMMIAFFIFSFVFLYHQDSKSKKE